MIDVPIELEHSPYAVTIGPGALACLGDSDAVRAASRLVIVTDTNVAPLYADRVRAAALGADAMIVTLPAGEARKDWQTLNLIFDALLANRCDRRTLLIALGGGVVGDMAGFAAATYMRGVPFVQVPTTLLAQVDSSVGGKTAINHPLGKNMIGAFHQPLAVFADIHTLHTLPARELSSGLAEVLKHGLIRDPGFFDWCERSLPSMRLCDSEALAHAVRRSVEIKAGVVCQDPDERGLRAILNFGHTFGHAIEAGLGYGQWTHGEAVGCGMVAAAELSGRLGYLEDADIDRIRAAVGAAGLPIALPPIPVARYLELMSSDKKARHGAVRFIVLEAIGRAAIRTVPAEALSGALLACGAAP